MFGKFIFIHKSPGLVPESWDEAGVSLSGERGECLVDSVRVAR